MRAVVNPHLNRSAVVEPSEDAWAFHQALPSYAATPLRPLPATADELGIAELLLKDESNRFGLPAFKVLGASWAAERALRQEPETHTLVAASAGNHGRAVAHVARTRGLRCRVFLPARAATARRDAIAAEGAELVIVDGDYEQAVAVAADESRQPGVVEVADVGTSGPAAWVIDGYSTLFREAAEQGEFDLLIVPVGVGSFAAAAVRFAAQTGKSVVGVEPETAACLSASLQAGEPIAVSTPGTAMAGMDCAEVSPLAWPTLRDGLDGVVTVSDEETRAAMRTLHAEGLRIGDCGAAPLAALTALLSEPAAGELRSALTLERETRVLLVATEGVTDPAGYAAAGLE